MKKEKEVYLTSEGFLNLEEELDKLKKVDRPEVIEAIKEARALGDLSENAEYSSARERQGKLEARIKEMRRQLELIDAEPNEQIDAGCLKYLTMDGEQKLEERKYYKNKISQYEKEAELARIKLEGLGEKIS